ncbi:translocation/assembly module TamB domain-containing protein [Cyanobacterium stanieri LEGE 03274]|uniref:Translocation/assembly module TamB domain-containing protein n=1 Tax=Cyanobacterium stanieri LEGE 03274 TaxID=1828756 RepID=A0ABR9V5F2_9CHRO|nr:translocation/assembly module TamB domain-containing protein [Cyanobacterium stanieri]MBE9223124.1 translocation/assembly module TamB domain-containing protein [Cyanobacterium stanieri LEGE 03274]
MTDFPDKTPNSDSGYDENLDNNSNSSVGKPVRSPQGFYIKLFLYGALLSVGGGLSYGWYFFTQRLIPLIEQPVSNYLGRPVELGNIESVSFNRIRVGESKIPTTDSQTDYVIAEAVEVNLKSLLFRERNANVEVTIINPLVYLEKSEDARWLDLQLNPLPKRDRFISFDVDEVRVKNASLTMKSLVSDLSPLNIKVNQGSILIGEDNLTFTTQGDVISGGNISLTAVTPLKSNDWLLDIRGNNLLTNDITYFTPLPIDVDSGKVTGNINLEFEGGEFVNIDGNMDVAGINLTIPNVPQTLTDSHGKINFVNNSLTLTGVNTNLGDINGDVFGSLEDDFSEVNINIKTKPVEVQRAIASLNLPKIPVETKGKVEGDINIQGLITQPILTANITATENLQIDRLSLAKSQGKVTILNRRLSIDEFSFTPTIGGEINGNGLVDFRQEKQFPYQVSLNTENISAETLATLYDIKISENLPPLGMLNGEYQISGIAQEIENSQITGITNIGIGEGEATISNLFYNQENYQADIALTNIPLKQINLINCQTIDCGNSTLQGNLQLLGDSQNISLDTITLQGNLNFPLAQGIVNLNNSQLNQGRWQTQLVADNLNLSQLNFTSDTPINSGRVNSALNIRGSINDNQGIQAEGEIFLPQGVVTVESLFLDGDNNFNTILATTGFNISEFQQGLRGDTRGRLSIQGNTNNITLSTVAIAANLDFSQGISLIQQPLKTAFGWDGEKILLSQATTGDISANGIINYDTDNQQVSNLDLNLIASNFDIQNLPLPNQLALVDYGGKFDFRGKLQGNLDNPQLVGNLQVANLEIANLSFNPLAGNIEANTINGIEFDLKDTTGNDDRFALNIDNNFQPREIDINVKESSLTAVTNERDILDINFTNFSLATLTQPLLTTFPSEIESVGGNISGQLALNLDSYDINSSALVVNNPQINQFRGDVLTATVSSLDGKIIVEDGKLNHLQNEYDFFAQILPFDENPQLEAEVSLKEGDIQNLLTSVGIFEIEDILDGIQPKEYCGAEDLYTTGDEISCLSIRVNSSLARLPLSTQSNDNNQVNGYSNRVLTRNSQNSISLPTDKVEEDIKTSSKYLLNDNSVDDEALKISRENQTKEIPVITHNLAAEDEGNGVNNQPIETQRNNFAVNGMKDNNDDGLHSPSVDSQVERRNSDDLTEKEISSSESDNTLVNHPTNLGEEENLLVEDETAMVREGKNIHALRKTLTENSLVEGEINTDNSDKLIIAQETTAEEEKKPLFSISSDGLSLQQTLFQWQQINSATKQAQMERQEANIPPLEDLQGRLTGKLNIIASLRDGIDASFDFRGDDWYWGKYQADTIQATGNFQDGLLTLLPVSFQDDETIISLSGTFSQERFSGQVLLTDLPIQNVGLIANLPPNFELQGITNGNIVISGNLDNPIATGSVEIANATINGTTIEETNANLGYRNSRLDFLATSNLTGEEESARLLGSFPFRFLPQSDNPDSDDFRFRLNIEESGFGLLRVVSNNQFNLVEGSGGVDLDIQGKYNQSQNTITDFIADGLATINDGVMEVAFIPDTPITNINGDILFDFDQITIPSLTGNFSQGNILVTGGLPLFTRDSQGDMLTASIDNLALSLPNLYQGNARGDMEIGGSAIAPIIGGNITLFDGDVFLSAGQGNNGNHSSNGNTTNIDIGSNPLISNTTVDNLVLTFGNDITITQVPVLNLNARGSLNLRGDINNLQPQGEIELTGGSVNLFTSRLRLNRNYNNIARFTPENGFNAFLDMQLETSVTETNRYQLADNTGANEIRDTSGINSIDTLETIRVRANVNGFSNNITDSLQLTSIPAREETEIIALLGGGFFNNFVDGDTGLTLANIAGAALFGSFQNQFDDILDRAEFRLFPTPIIDSDTRVSSLALGAELAFNVRENLAFSVLTILTGEQPTRYNIRYRLNDRTVIRGSTDFGNDTRSAIEYQFRF